MMKIEIQKAEGFHKFLVSLFKSDGDWIWSDIWTAEETEKTVKIFCRYRDEKHLETEIIGERAVLKELGLLRVKEK